MAARRLTVAGAPEHRTAIVVGGGPAGLPLAAVLGGWHPFYRESAMLRQRYPQIAQLLGPHRESLLQLPFEDLLQAGIQPADLFRLLHHPRQLFEGLEQIAMEFRQTEPIDCLLLTQEEVGGLWNNVPENLLTLSPGQWMEFAFYPLAQHAAETGDSYDVNELIIKRRLVDYYHRVPDRFGVEDRIHRWTRVTRVEPHEEGFLVTAVDVSDWKEKDPAALRRPAFPQTADAVEQDHPVRQYTCKYLVWAVGQRGELRSLDVPGEELPCVTQFYNSPRDFPGERVLVVGGGRSADWAATELHDAGRQVTYVMRQSRANHWALIHSSRGGLPYYTRIAEILEEEAMDARYETRIQRIEAAGEGARVVLDGPQGERTVEVDHVLKEIGGRADYSLIQGFPQPLQLVEMRDNYRFQVMQARVHPHSYESVDIPNLYPGGYLAEGLGLVVIAMHGTTYAIAAEILRKEGRL
jgi:cation diffusion facilitator CzcD-associated flavoprotein CzcO